MQNLQSLKRNFRYCVEKFSIIPNNQHFEEPSEEMGRDKHVHGTSDVGELVGEFRSVKSAIFSVVLEKISRNYAKFYLFWERSSKILIKEGVEEHADIFSVLKGLIWSYYIRYLEQNEDQNATIAESSSKNDSPECVVRSLHQ